MRGAGVGQAVILSLGEGTARAALRRRECGRGEELREGLPAGQSQGLPSSANAAQEQSPHGCHYGVCSG